jgi:hypothetical protein
MRTRYTHLLLCLAGMLFFSSIAFAQQQFNPRDLSGIWRAAVGGNRKDVEAFAPGQSLTENPPPMTPEGQARFNANKPGYGPRAVPPALGNDPISYCDPLGYPRLIFFGRPVEIIQTKDRMLQFYEWTRVLREIWTDGRELPKDPDPKWLGTAVGKWDGDTFVIDSVGFDERSWLDHFGSPHSDQMRLQERIRRVDQNTLEIVMTLTDPVIYAQPWVSDKLLFRLQPNDRIREEFCVPSEEESFNQGVRNPAGGVTGK